MTGKGGTKNEERIGDKGSEWDRREAKEKEITSPNLPTITTECVSYD